jgi:methylphosphotriester-DNA--protein-cysteine methyltransferase
VASKSGSIYYLPNCSGVKNIKDENKVWFATEEDAAAAGYGKAANCPGL